MDLFRREALDGQDRLHGEVVFIPQVSWRMLLAFFLAALAVAALFLVTARYRPVTSVAGRIAAHDGSLVASFEMPTAATRRSLLDNAASLRPGLSRRSMHAWLPRPLGRGTTIVHAALDGAATPPLRPA